MVQMTILASLVVTLLFSATALKVMADVEKVIPAPTAKAASASCGVTDLKSTHLGTFDSIEN